MSSLVPAIGAKRSMKRFGLWDQRRGVGSCSCYRGQTLDEAFRSLGSATGPEKIDPNWGRDGGTHAAAVGARHLRLAELSQPSGLDCGSLLGGRDTWGQQSWSRSSWLLGRIRVV
jgi:hypothetical protein